MTLKTRMIISFMMAVLFISAPVWAEESKIHFHGYGELHYNGQNGAVDKVDFHRMVWGLSYQYNDRISVHSEVDFEHAAQEMELEYAHVDFNISPLLNVRAGAMLMPVGHLNEFHEPPLFYSVERAKVQSTVIPTTWQEAGIGLFGASDAGLKYRLYFVSGLNAKGFESGKGIREGRSKMSAGHSSVNDKTLYNSGDDFAVVARVEYAGIPGVNVGFSGYSGGADQGVDANNGVDVTIVEGDLRYRWKGLDITAVYAQVDIGDAQKLSAKKVGEKITGFYGEVGYDLLSYRGGKEKLVTFVRVEEVNTHAAVPTGVTADPKNDLTIKAFGLAFYPISDVAFKVDWQTEEDGTGADKEFVNAGVAYMF